MRKWVSLQYTNQCKIHMNIDIAPSHTPSFILPINHETVASSQYKLSLYIDRMGSFFLFCSVYNRCVKTPGDSLNPHSAKNDFTWKQVQIS